MDAFADETVFEKEQCMNILKAVAEETVGHNLYTQAKVGQWISEICEKSTKKLVALGKPFKYVVTCVIMQRNGAGLHTASSCFWDNANDGSCTFRVSALRIHRMPAKWGYRRSTTPVESREATSECSSAAAASSILSSKATHHLVKRMEEREVPWALVKETFRKGLKCGNRHISDHITVISAPQESALITTYRNGLSATWPAVELDGAGGIHLNTTYMFFQHGDHIMFAGLQQAGAGNENIGVEVGFGRHVVQESNSKCFFDTVSIFASRHAFERVEHRKLKLDQLFVRERHREGSTTSGSGIADTLDTVVRGGVDTLPVVTLDSVSSGEVKTLIRSESLSRDKDYDGRSLRDISATIQGDWYEHISVLRWLRTESPTQSKIESWICYNYDLFSKSIPTFSYTAIVQELSKCKSRLPELSGRWKLDEGLIEYPGFSAFTLVALPIERLDDGRLYCMVFCIQSNDAEENNPKYSRFGVGSAFVSCGEEQKVVMTPSVRLRLSMARIDINSPYRQRIELEGGQGDVHEIMWNNGYKLIRMGSDDSNAGDKVPFDDSSASSKVPFSFTESAVPPEAVRILHNILPYESNLRDAILLGDVDRVRDLLTSSRDKVDLWKPIDTNILRHGCFNAKHGIPVIPVIAAALAGQLEVMEELLHIQLDDLDAFGLCVVGSSLAARKRLAEMIRQNPELVLQVCPKKTSSPNGMERNHDLYHIKRDSNGTHDVRFEGCSLLEIAARMRHTEVVEMLERAGAKHKMHTAVLMGNWKWVEDNIQRGSREVNDHFDTRTMGNGCALAHGMTPLLEAIRLRHLPLVKTLLSKGADIFKPRRGYESTAVNWAQVYDSNEEGNFPTLRAILIEFRCRRAEASVPDDWFDLRERCSHWRHGTHPAALRLIDDLDFDCFEADDDEAASEAGESWDVTVDETEAACGE